ncbi:CD5 antigen-like [Thalassophryne amazonica]|uniref:CD5 antigen-like n=1 Tax=Thalassophryne amazonica TaxID=390379 RepID=UPI001471D9CC|nr:CD5 antigen-like [Thalassophryne amazonica]
MGQCNTSHVDSEGIIQASVAVVGETGHSSTYVSSCIISCSFMVEMNTEKDESVRLVGGANHCAGRLEVKVQEDWRPVVDSDSDWTMKAAGVVCAYLDCGSAVYTECGYVTSFRPVWEITSDCVHSGSSLRDCVISSDSSASSLQITCSDSVRLVHGSSLCSGRLEVKLNQSWSSVCEDDFDLQDAEVVCGELGCGPPSLLQGMNYEDINAPKWTKEFHCGGNETGLLDCGSSGSQRNTCSSGRAVGLTCSESVRLVGGSSHCAGTLEVKLQEDWRPVVDWDSDWTLKAAAVVCQDLDCGSAVYTESRDAPAQRPVWMIRSNCLESGSALRDCVISPDSSATSLQLTCSDSVRLVHGSSLCSGRLEVKLNQSWSLVCDDDFDLQDAQVVCGELGCGPPSVLQGMNYEDVDAPKWTKEFHCGGNESGLLDCGSSGSDRNTCSPGSAVGLTCSELLFQPTISLSSSSVGGVYELQQEEFQVFEGSNVTIRCSIQPQYPGGSFILTFTSSNTTRNSTQSAVNHSALFAFPAAHHTHQGNYSCAYHVHFFSHNFSSESHLLSLTVSGVDAAAQDGLSSPNIEGDDKEE